MERDAVVIEVGLNEAVTRDQWPEALRVVDELPRTPSGKIKRFVLRAHLREISP